MFSAFNQSAGGLAALHIVARHGAPLALGRCEAGFNPTRAGPFVAELPGNWHKAGMCFHATISGAILPVWSKTAYDEVMLRCARIGFKP